MLRVHAHVLALVVAVTACGKRPAGDGTRPASPRAPGTTSAAEVPGDEDAVLAVFAAYREAALARDGRRVRALVDRKTVEVYGVYLDLARTVDRAGLLRLGWYARLMVLRLRHEFDRAGLDALAGERLLEVSIEQGWLSDEAVRSARVAEVGVDGDRAGISLEPEPTVPVLFLFREADGWKLGLWFSFLLVERGLQSMYERSGVTDEVSWMISVVEAASARPLDRAIVDGPPR